MHGQTQLAVYHAKQLVQFVSCVTWRTTNASREMYSHTQEVSPDLPQEGFFQFICSIASTSARSYWSARLVPHQQKHSHGLLAAMARVMKEEISLEVSLGLWGGEVKPRDTSPELCSSVLREGQDFIHLRESLALSGCRVLQQLSDFHSWFKLPVLEGYVLPGTSCFYPRDKMRAHYQLMTSLSHW